MRHTSGIYMQESKHNGLDDIITQALEDMKAEQGNHFPLHQINLAELERCTSISFLMSMQSITNPLFFPSNTQFTREMVWTRVCFCKCLSIYIPARDGLHPPRFSQAVHCFVLLQWMEQTPHTLSFTQQI